MAKSKDGKKNWSILPDLILGPDTNIGEEQYGLEDPRNDQSKAATERF